MWGCYSIGAVRGFYLAFKAVEEMEKHDPDARPKNECRFSTHKAINVAKALVAILDGVVVGDLWELIKARTSDGRARAKTRGVHMGRPPKLTPISERKPLRDETPARRWSI
jgi:hypothetical protein